MTLEILLQRDGMMAGGESGSKKMFFKWEKKKYVYMLMRMIGQRAKINGVEERKENCWKDILELVKANLVPKQRKNSRPLTGA